MGQLNWVFTFLVSSFFIPVSVTRFCKDCGPYGYCIRKANGIELRWHNSIRPPNYPQTFRNFPPFGNNATQDEDFFNSFRTQMYSLYDANFPKPLYAFNFTHSSNNLQQNQFQIPYNPNYFYNFATKSSANENTIPNIILSDEANCLECVCPRQIRGKCCEEVPDICSEVHCPLDSFVTKNRYRRQIWMGQIFQQNTNALYPQHLNLNQNYYLKSNLTGLVRHAQQYQNNYYLKQHLLATTMQTIINSSNGNNIEENGINIDDEMNKNVTRLENKLRRNWIEETGMVCRQLSEALDFFACVCAPNFAGDHCDEPINNCGVCSAHATRNCKRINDVEAFCECHDNYEGRFCELCKDDKAPKCVNGGRCFINTDGAMSCRCIDDFTGSYCQKVSSCYKNLCQHGGICLPNDLTNNSIGYTCVCSDIWTGTYCENFNACQHNATSKCLNNGICKPIGDNKFLCDCGGTGFTGALCDENVDDCLLNVDGDTHNGTLNVLNAAKTDRGNKCQQVDSNAICIDGINEFKCNCSANFAGKLCDIPIVTWTLLQDFPDLTETELSMFLELMAKEDAREVAHVLPFLTTDVEQTALSWTHTDLFIWAAFQGQEINIEEFVKWNDPLFGNCFTFNHAKSPYVYRTSGAGADNGFEALLHVHEDEYMAWTESAGIALFLHARDERIFTDSPRYYAASQTSTQFAISKKEFTRLGGLYGNCVNSPNDVHTYFYEGTYTVEGCVQSCYQNAIHLICGCTDPRFPGITGVADCTLSQGACVLNVTDKLGDASEWIACECAPPCNKTDFLVNVRAADIISKPFMENDSIHISVYFAKDYLLRYNEIANMDFNRYISFFGGVVGVVAGFSVISVVEFGFLVYRLLLTFCTNESVSLDEAEVQDLDDDIII